MYSKRRSKRAPGSVHAPCTLQLVFTMQNAVPQEAAASPARPQASAATIKLFMPSSSQLENANVHRRREGQRCANAIRSGAEALGEKQQLAKAATAAVRHRGGWRAARQARRED